VREISVLYDGWDLAYQPNSPAALHLLALLHALPSELRATVCLPMQAFHSLPLPVDVVIDPVPDQPSACLGWEQRRLPMQARRLKVDLVHWLDGGPSLFGSPANIVSPAGYAFGAERVPGAGASSGFLERLRDALSHGGLARARALFWPEDLPKPGSGMPVINLPPLSSFWEELDVEMKPAELSAFLGDQELPETYILYQGLTSRREIMGLLESWSWAAGAIGDYYPLWIVGVDESEQPGLKAWIQAHGLGDTVRLVPPLPLKALAPIYRNCSALFHPGVVSPWDGPLRMALFFGRPIVALESSRADAIVGPAAYLVPLDGNGRLDRRALGAALVAVIVEESLAQGLSQAARQRALGWSRHNFAVELKRAYQSLLDA